MFVLPAMLTVLRDLLAALRATLALRAMLTLRGMLAAALTGHAVQRARVLLLRAVFTALGARQTVLRTGVLTARSRDVWTGLPVSLVSSTPSRPSIPPKLPDLGAQGPSVPSQRT
jgi:hypothetical protein